MAARAMSNALKRDRGKIEGRRRIVNRPSPLSRVKISLDDLKVAGYLRVLAVSEHRLVGCHP